MIQDPDYTSNTYVVITTNTSGDNLERYPTQSPAEEETNQEKSKRIGKLHTSRTAKLHAPKWMRP